MTTIEMTCGACGRPLRVDLTDAERAGSLSATKRCECGESVKVLLGVEQARQQERTVHNVDKGRSTPYESGHKGRP